MDAAWFATTLMQDWPQRSGIADAVWQGSGPSLLAFYAASLESHPQWRLPVDDGLVSQVRTRLIRQLGQRNSESTLLPEDARAGGESVCRYAPGGYDCRHRCFASVQH